jgi:hypothetical protein
VSRASPQPQPSLQPHVSPHVEGTTTCRGKLVHALCLAFNSFRRLHSNCTVEARRLYRQRALVGLYACCKQACRALATSDEDGRPARVAVVLKEGAYHDATQLLYPFIFLHDLGQSLAVLTVRIVEQLNQCVRTPPWPFSGMCLAFSPADISEI